MAWKTHKPPSGIPARGPGWGGEAKGYRDAPAFTVDQQPAAEAKVKGRRMAETAREVAKENAVATMRKILAMQDDPTAPHQTRLDAMKTVVNRAEGMPGQSVDMTSKGERLPGYVMTAPAEIEDAAEWAARHKPKPRE